MLAKIRREVADPQPTVRIAVIGMGLNEFPQRLAMPPVPDSILFKDGLRVESGIELHREYEIAGDRGVAGVECDGPAIGGDGLTHFSLVLKDSGEITVSYHAVGTEGDGLTDQILRNIVLSRPMSNRSQKVQCSGVLWLLGKDLPTELLRLPQPPGLLMLDGQ